jgi:transcriptional regulator NrdR family protein
MGFNKEVTGMVYIVECDVCGETFATFETLTGVKIVINVDLALIGSEK